MIGLVTCIRNGYDGIGNASHTRANTLKNSERCDAYDAVNVRVRRRRRHRCAPGECTLVLLFTYRQNGLLYFAAISYTEYEIVKVSSV